MYFSNVNFQTVYSNTFSSIQICILITFSSVFSYTYSEYKIDVFFIFNGNKIYSTMSEIMSRHILLLIERFYRFSTDLYFVFKYEFYLSILKSFPFWSHLTLWYCCRMHTLYMMQDLGPQTLWCGRTTPRGSYYLPHEYFASSETSPPSHTVIHIYRVVF